MQELIKKYRAELQQELVEILSYWQANVVDENGTGFIGQINGSNERITNAPRGAVLNTRILWTFAAAYNLTADRQYLDTATRAYEYITAHLLDRQYGGVYWTVNADGSPLDPKKQIYAQAFAIYSFSEYFLASADEDAKNNAISLYETLNRYGYDKQQGGYFEAFARDWTELSDIRLSDKDLNAPKSMNTHLHVLEAFANLYRIWPKESLKEQIVSLLHIFLQRIVARGSAHLNLFFENDWTPRGAMVSYGHDVEASWLLPEAAERIGDQALTTALHAASLQLAVGTLEGMDADGGIWHEYDESSDHWLREKHWWTQAEAMVGFFNAWQLTDQPIWLQHAMQSWRFVQKHIRDHENGEWYWGVDQFHKPMTQEDKAGIWKCPYHNARACMEIIRRTT